MFIGHITHAIDAKGRLTVPQRLREVSASADTTSQWDRVVLTASPQRDSIHVYLQQTWAEMMQASLGGRVIPDQESMKFQRLAGSMTHSVDCDKMGRIVLPADLKELAGIEREALWIGAGIRAEIWNPETWNRYFTENVDGLSGMWEELSRQCAVAGLSQGENVQLSQQKAGVE